MYIKMKKIFKASTAIDANDMTELESE